MNNVDSRLRGKLAVIGTGGTFAMQARHPFDWVEYSESGIVLPIDDLLGQLGELAPEVEMLPIPFRALGSTAITPSDWLALASLIRKTALERPDIDGFVVTHGTATLEETAWFLHLTVDIDAGVVVTGAQRPSNTAGSDVVPNLRAAMAVALNPRSAECGALVVMDNAVFSARDVTKSSSFHLNAFEAPLCGPLAEVDADANVNWRRLPVQPACGKAFDPDALMSLPRVDILTSYGGADGVAVDAVVAAGARGLVSAGLAPGRPANGEVQALARAIERGVVVVQSTRAARGMVPLQDFLRRSGVLAGGDLAPHKARILLMLALAQGLDKEAIQQLLLAS
ncbi:asparaginase [Pseudomonas sp. BN515]|uniref:asparaginase n=1 Tax=Pseudomonas sp. BN515 TaxID=2567892 RepID=UPI0024572177|nr:asparaginase [Pseudomonas sp. BN515]MDH4872012.1 asparaginase [Pseudomonas sp. BN515]